MADIGTTLREARIRARIDMSEVEARTKIRAKYLRAIENEEWDLLPGPVYVKSFLRTYGDFLGLEYHFIETPWLSQYVRRVGANAGKGLFEDGVIPLTDAPGLGVELDEQVCRANLANGESLFD